MSTERATAEPEASEKAQELVEALHVAETCQRHLPGKLRERDVERARENLLTYMGNLESDHETRLTDQYESEIRTRVKRRLAAEPDRDTLGRSWAVSCKRILDELDRLRDVARQVLSYDHCDHNPPDPEHCTHCGLAQLVDFHGDAARKGFDARQERRAELTEFVRGVRAYADAEADAWLEPEEVVFEARQTQSVRIIEKAEAMLIKLKRWGMADG